MKKGRLPRKKKKALNRKYKISGNLILELIDDELKYLVNYTILVFKKGELKKATRINPEKVRTNQTKEKFFICDDWGEVGRKIKELKPFSKDKKKGIGREVFIIDLIKWLKKDQVTNS